MRKTLKIYKASAGSGKTFTLALEYMKLLVQDPYCYRNILAVTFTNKATAEMKERILGKLYGVANRSKGAKDYMDKLREQLPGMSEDVIVERARQALDLILHDYGHFRIQTIDAFFQSVLRGLAKELDLSGDMEISINGKELLDEAVDTYIRGLEPGQEGIAQVIQYIEEQLANGNDWHVENAIKQFAKNILKEEYQDRGDKLRMEIDKEDGKALKDFRREVTRLKDNSEAAMNGICDRFFELTKGMSVDDFRGKTRGSAWSFFASIRNKGVLAPLSAKQEEMIANPSKISPVASCCNGVAQLLAEYKRHYTSYTSCTLALHHIHQLGMLNNIARTLKEENARENRFLLADTTHLLCTLIKENTSFIFEKIGTEIDHIFIDEFQDTSRLQWQCFEVLLREILARGKFNLIVGDVKQAIYRWRNGDWKIMNDLADYFREYGDTLEFESQECVVGGKMYSSVNYRSDRRIISFNNALYRSAINVLETTYSEELGSRLGEITSAYSDVEQAYPQPAPGKKEKPVQGYVEARIFKPGSYKKKNFERLVIDRLMETLHTLLEEKGVAPKDIAILLRTNDRIEAIVEAFKQEFPGLKIVSDDAYRLSSSLTVSLAIAAMRYIALPEDKVNIANLLGLYNKVILKKEQPLDGYVSKGELIEMLPESFRSDLEHMKGLPVYELIERLMAILNIEESKGEESYIYAFLDHMSQYISSKSADLTSLLAAWDEGLCDKCIPAENDDSIKVMTIHKSKGLEFHTVIIPFCDWKLTADSRNLLWCKSECAPFDGLSLLPIHSKKEMKDSVFSEDYSVEYMYQIVDNLNILYVATTRAKSNLILFSEEHRSDVPYVWKMFNKAVAGMPALDGMSKDEDSEFRYSLTVKDEEGEDVVQECAAKEDVYIYGSVVPSKSDDAKDASEEKEDNPFETEALPLKLPLTFHKNSLEVKQSRELARFMASGKEKKQLENIAEGELMHMVMSEIETASDIDKALDRLLLQGIIEDTAKIAKIKQRVLNALSNPLAREWFDGSYRLYNERTILNRKYSEAKRPDRVMIKGNEAIVVDYKFGREDDTHDTQVRRYMDLLRDMDYENVKGYLWYVYKNEIKPVTL